MSRVRLISIGVAVIVAALALAWQIWPDWMLRFLHDPSEAVSMPWYIKNPVVAWIVKLGIPISGAFLFRWLLPDHPWIGFFAGALVGILGVWWIYAVHLDDFSSFTF